MATIQGEIKRLKPFCRRRYFCAPDVVVLPRMRCIENFGNVEERVSDCGAAVPMAGRNWRMFERGKGSGVCSATPSMTRSLSTATSMVPGTELVIPPGRPISMRKTPCEAFSRQGVGCWLARPLVPQGVSFAIESVTALLGRMPRGTVEDTDV